MNISRGLLSLFFCTCLFQGFITPKNKLREGIIIQGHRFYDGNLHEIKTGITGYDSKVWFLDSCVIYEMVSLNMYTDSYHKSTSGVTIDRYVYLDLKTMIYYDYSNFSDTATLLRRYTLHPDSTNLTWRFFRHKQLIPSLDSLVAIKDTVVNGKNYKRMQKEISRDEGGKTLKMVCTYYMQCGMPKSIFHLDGVFDDKFNDCEASRFDYYIVGKPNRYLSFYEIISDTLSSTEHKIFKKWSQNALTTNLSMEHSWKFDQVATDSIEARSKRKSD